MTDFQKYLDEATRWQVQEMWAFHDLNCNCWRCAEIQQIEHEARWGKK